MERAAGVSQQSEPMEQANGAGQRSEPAWSEPTEQWGSIGGVDRSACGGGSDILRIPFPYSARMAHSVAGPRVVKKAMLRRCYWTERQRFYILGARRSPTEAVALRVGSSLRLLATMAAAADSRGLPTYGGARRGPNPEGEGSYNAGSQGIHKATA